MAVYYKTIFENTIIVCEPINQYILMIINDAIILRILDDRYLLFILEL